MMKNLKFLAILSLILAIALISGCSQYGKQAQDNSQQKKAAENAVDISDFAFNPQELIIQKSATIVWTNKDSARHTVTSDSGSELGSKILSTGGSYSHTFSQTGTFEYHCDIHKGMKGKIIVK